MSVSHIPSAADILGTAAPLPQGVGLRKLTSHSDHRGCFTEIFRNEWELSPAPVQWNMVRSTANVLRGVHVHLRHADILTMAAGEMVLGLSDLRRSYPTHGLSVIMRLNADDLHVVVIPVGVAHGFYFAEPACHIYAVSEPFDGSDELGCRWNDPDLRLPWPCEEPLLSQRDATAGPLAALLPQLGALQPNSTRNDRWLHKSA